MNYAANLPLLTPVSEIPFSQRRGSIDERFCLIRLLGRAMPSKFRPPPLKPVFGPGTKMPKGPVVQKPRKSKKR